MQQTPVHSSHNPDVLTLMPAKARRVVEVGCSGGALAHAYRAANPDCDYIGIEIEESYAELALPACSRVIVGNVETLDDALFGTLAPVDCWVFGDVLEHLYDPWTLLRRVHKTLDAHGCVVACIPNAQHWSMQAKLNSGLLRYKDAGLLDRTHIRWFTRVTIEELFASAGFEIVDDIPRIFEEPERDRYLRGVRAFAHAVGSDENGAVADAIALQWVVRAVCVQQP